MRIRFNLAGYEIEALVAPEDRSVGFRATLMQTWIRDQEGGPVEWEELEHSIQDAIEEEACRRAGEP